MKSKFCVLLLAALACIPFPVAAGDFSPLQVRNQNPFVLLFGIPPSGRASVLSKGRVSVALGVNISSHNAATLDLREPSTDEAILLDGETYHTVLEMRYGLTDRLEIGGRIPYVMHRGGALDDFIMDWHDFFGLPQGGRTSALRDRLSFRYSRNDRFLVNLDENVQGVGDIGLFTIWQWLREDADGSWDIALRMDLEIPTGDSERLLGSGSTDLAVSTSAAREEKTRWGEVLLYGSAGLLVMTTGDVLPELQKNMAGFGTIGAGIRPWRAVDFKLQIDGHTPLYENTDLDPLGPSAQLSIGGTLHFSEKTVLDLAVVEDIVVDSAPDVTFHLSLRRDF